MGTTIEKARGRREKEIKEIKAIFLLKINKRHSSYIL